MTIFQDILSDQAVERVEVTEPLVFTLFGQPFAPTKLYASVCFRPTVFEDLSLEVVLDKASEVEQVQPLLAQTGYSVDQIKALVFSQATPVRLVWRVRPQMLSLFQKELLPFESVAQIWEIRSTNNGNQVFLNLDRAYQFIKIEV